MVPGRHGCLLDLATFDQAKRAGNVCHQLSNHTTGTPGQHLQTHHCHNTMLTSGRAAMGGVGEEGERMGGG